MRPTTIKKEKRSYSLKYYYKNAVKLRDRALKYYHNNKEKCNRRHMVWRNKLRDEIIIKFGNKCKRCGFNDKRALQIDHVNGGGCKETNGLSPATFYKKVAGESPLVSLHPPP